MSQPKIEVPKTSLDYLLLGLGILGLLIMISLTAIYFDQLPDRIPTHFNSRGEADSYGDKSTLWFLVLVAIAIYSIILLANRSPHLFNYSVPITPENAARQYQNLQRLNRAMMAVISLSITYIHYAIIEMSLGEREGLGLWFLLVFLAVLFGVMGYFLYRAHTIR